MGENLNTSQKTQKNGPKPDMDEILDELQLRFLMNLPASELESSERLFFQIEQCYWFYEDFYADQYNHLQHMKLNDFAKKMFHHCILLQPLKHKCDEMFADFKAYQYQIPVVGCIMLNRSRNKILLVRNWKGTSWTFPKGKVNQGEEDVQCAQREALEECGYDASHLMDDKNYLEFFEKQQRCRMYIVVGVPEEYAFAPRTRKEISLIQMFPIDNLPKKTWCVTPFMARLKRWIARDNLSKGKNNNLSNALNKNRATSLPKNRPQKRNSINKKKESIRSQSRGHFGTEYETSTCKDGCNQETFGESSACFSVDEMFRINENLTGQKFEYDGNPNDFGSGSKKKLNGGQEGVNQLIAPVATLFSNFSLQPPPLIPLSIHTSSSVQIIEGVHDESQLLLYSTHVESKPKQQQREKEETKEKSGDDAFSSFQFDTVDIMACVN